MKELQINSLYSLDETIAADLFDGATYPWEVLPKIKDFIIELGQTLPADKFEEVKEELGEDADQIKRMGITVDKDGVVTYFAELTKQTVRMQEDRLQEQKELRADKKEKEEKAERKKGEKEKVDHKTESGKVENTPVNPNKVTASTIEELTAKIKELLAERAKSKTDQDEVKEEKEQIHLDIVL